MNRLSLTRNISLAIAVVCVGIAYLPLGTLRAGLAVCAVLVFTSIAYGRPAPSAGSGLLAIYVVLSVIGVLLKAALLPTVTGCIAALVWWDLMDFKQSVYEGVPQKRMSLLEKYRLQSLGMVAGTSAVLTAAVLWLRVQLPFGIIATLVVLGAGGILYSVRRLRGA